MYCQTEEEFRSIPGLRIKNDVDGCAIAPAFQAGRDVKTHLYFHGPGKLGIYFEQKTRKEAAAVVCRYRHMIGHLEIEKGSLIGEYDGIILFRVTSEADIPDIFFKKGQPPPVERSRIDAEGGGGSPDTPPVETKAHGPGLTWTRDADGKPICIPVAGG